MTEAPVPGKPCTCSAIRRAARHLSQSYDRFLAPTGLRTTQFSLLRVLERTGPRSIQALAAEMGLDRTTLGRNLRPLERDGFVSIGIDPRDRRGRALSITPAGEAKLREARVCWEAAQASFTETYGPEQTQRLHALLDGLAKLDFIAKPG
ncbi:MAG TPA: MarR family winged helix-turn-helix transcriptional regulator [Acetobacteraceae bacterium]|jgi:DNA-binding MarR family transcriptional regulator|nr:MarR family winged helix-turn-helix transcriptional regulator [Acetobacteraceae bacterium]